MQKLPQDELRESLSLLHPGANGSAIDNQTALRLKRRLAEGFRTQLTIGAPTNADEAGLRPLASQLWEKKLVGQVAFLVRQNRASTRSLPAVANDVGNLPNDHAFATWPLLNQAVRTFREGAKVVRLERQYFLL